MSALFSRLHQEVPRSRVVQAMRRLCSLLLLAGVVACDPPTEPDGRMVRWSVTQFGGTTGTPYADEDVVVAGVAFSNRLIAVDRESGVVLWQRFLSLPTTAMGGRQISPNMEVIRFGDLLIVASNWLHAMDRLTGEPVWSFTPSDDWPGRNAVLAGDRLIGTGERVYSIDPSTGDVEWERDLGELPSALTYDDGVVYFGARAPMETETPPTPLGAGHVMAMDAATGEVLWKYFVDDHPTEAWVGGVVGRGALYNGSFIVSAPSSRVFALDRESGAEQWIHEGDATGYRTAVQIIGNVVVVAGSSGVVEGLDPQAGDTLWEGQVGSSVRRLGVAGDLALAANGRIWAYDTHGNERWAFGGAGWNQPTFGTEPVVHDGVLFANSVSYGLFAIDFPL